MGLLACGKRALRGSRARPNSIKLHRLPAADFFHCTKRSTFLFTKRRMLFLVTAGVVAPLFFRLRVSPVLGYLLAGVALGPFGLGRFVGDNRWLGAFAISNVETIDRIAAFGVVFLLVHDGARTVVRASSAHAQARVRPRARAGRRDDARHQRDCDGRRPQDRRGPDAGRRAGDVLDRDRHSGAHPEQAHRRGRSAARLWRCCCFRTSRSRLCL